MAQTGDFLKSAGAHSSTAAAAAQAAMAARPGPGQRGEYQDQYKSDYDGLTQEERKLLPDPDRVAYVAAEDPGGLGGGLKDPVKINVGSYGAGGPSSFSAATPEFKPQAGAPDGHWGGMPGMAPFSPYAMGGFGAPPNPFLAPAMAGYAWPYVDPSLMPGMGKGGMPFMPMPGMAPMFPMGGMPPGMMAGGSPGGHKKGGHNQDQGAKSQEKTRERRRRKKMGKGGTEDAPEEDDAAVTRSDELNEVRRCGQGKCKLSLEQVMPHAIEFAMDQHGSRFLQTKVEESDDPAEKLALFEAILPQTKAMSSNQFGNFVVQKLFDIGTAEQKRKLADELQGAVLQLAKEQHGCRVIQKALQLLPRDAQTKLAMELQDEVAGCIESMHGNHVIQKCIEQMPPDSVNFIIDAVSDQVEKMANDMYGCRVIQRLLEHCAPHQLQEMLQKIEACTAQLAQNPYGNYVVQHMLEHGRPEDKKKILEIVKDNIMDFAKNKCSSNVVEKCFEIATIGEHADALKDDRARLFAVVLTTRPGEMLTPLQQLTDDRFGNYIVQRMLEHSRGEERESLKRQLLQNSVSLQSSTNGKHILSALQKEFQISIPSPDEQ